MKTKIYFLAFLVIGLTAVFSSCSKDDDKPAATTGGLVIKVKIAGSTGYYTGADVAIATSQANLDAGTFLQLKVTDAQGSANFGQLNPANYYYATSFTVGSTDYYGEGEVQIVAGQNQELTLTTSSK